MRSLIAAVFLSVQAFACAFVSPPGVLAFDAPRDLWRPGLPANEPPPHDFAKKFRVVMPDGDWAILKRDQVLPGDNIGLFNRRTGAFVTFQPVLLADPCAIAKLTREQMTLIPGARASDIDCSADNSVAGFMVEEWTTDDPSMLRVQVAVMARSVPGKQFTPVLVLGGWTSDCGREMFEEFEMIVMSMTYE